MNNITKTHKALVIALIVAVIAAGGVAVEQYATRPKVAPQPSVAQVEKQRDQAESLLAAQKKTDASALSALNASNAALSAQKTAVCSQLALHRLTSVDCK